MNFDINNLISPNTKMPVPNHYFFIVVQEGDRRNIIPAILKCYCDCDSFYDNCSIFNTDGEAFKVKGLNPVGWIEMFDKTKSYKVQHL